MSRPSETPAKRPRGRWYQYSLRTLLGVMTLAVGLAMAWRVYVEPYRQQRQTMKLIEDLGGTYETEQAAKWLRRLYGDDFQNITAVNLADCDRADEYIHPLASLPQLRSAVVGGLTFDVRHLRRLGHVSTLRSLVLDSTSISEEEADAWRAEHAGPHARDLYLSQRRAIAALRDEVGILIDDAPTDPTTLKESLSVEYYHAALTVVTDRTANEGARLDYLRCLHTAQGIMLEGPAIDDATLANLSGLRHLETLHLTGASIGDDGLRHLAALPRLEFLLLARTNVTNDGLDHLASLSSLRRLDLSATRVDDRGLVKLRPLQLTQLYLSATSVTDAGLAHLAALTSLEKLDLAATQITDGGLPHLRSLTNLQTLYLHSTAVTADRVDALRHALPRCFVGGP